MGKCKLQPSWLQKNDSRGRLVKEWGKIKSDHELYCFLCNKTISVSLKGFQAVTQHAEQKVHERNIRLISANQTRLFVQNELAEQSTSNHKRPATVKIFSVQERVSVAELVWCLKLVASDFSFSSCNGLAETFQVMFSDSDIPKDFALGNNKAQYLVTDALSPYFKGLFNKDMQDALFSLVFDETTNASGKKELQTGVRYWSPTFNKIVFRHLQTFYINSATSSILVEKITEAMDNSNLPLQNLLMVGSDGPNVNKSAIHTLNEQVKALRQKPLINIGTCNIHTVHNAFLKGLEECGNDVSDLIFALHHFFDHWPSRWEEYRKIQESLSIKNHVFIKHCPSRWLTLEPAATRLLEQWPAVKKYFLEHIPKKRKKLEKISWYKKIVYLLKKTAIYSEVMFVISSAQIFTRVTGFLQKEQPLVHILHSQIHSLVQTIMGRICTPESLNTVDYDFIDDHFKADNLINVENIILDEKIRAELTKLNQKDKAFFLLGVQKHYVASVKHVVKKSSLKSTFLKSLAFLRPSGKSSDDSADQILEVSRSMPWDVKTDVLLDEWKLLKLEPEGFDPKDLPIDQYWKYFMDIKGIDGSPKFPEVSKVIKACLSLSHGNSDAERGFSASGRTLTSDRASMSERTLNALLTVKAALKAFDNKPHLVPITKELTSLSRTANQSYKSYLLEKKKEEDDKAKKEKQEKENKMAEEANKLQLEKKRKDINEAEQKLKKLRKEEAEKFESASTLLSEANERLKLAIKKKDFKEAALAHAMLEGVAKVQEEASQQRVTLESVQDSVQKKKTLLITNFLKKV